MRVEVLDDHRCRLGEGPMWDARSSEVFWVDILAGAVHGLRIETGARRTIPVGIPVSAIVPRQERDGWMVALESGVATLHETGSLTHVASYEVNGAASSCAIPMRSNDGTCDWQGRFWIGTMARNATPGAGGLYRLDAWSEAAVMALSGVTISNGPAFSADSTRMYHVDSSTERVDVFDFDADAGLISRRRTFLDIPAGVGIPDGITVDSDDCVWLVLHGAGRVNRYTPQGILDRAIELPTPEVTSCAFVGHHLDLLAVTSRGAEACEGRSRAGFTFVIAPGVSGLPTAGFRG